jgi:hypothetical protein
MPTLLAPTRGDLIDRLTFEELLILLVAEALGGPHIDEMLDELCA